MAKILDGRKAAADMRAEVAQDVEALVTGGHRRPKLVAVLVGEDPASETYVAAKARACEKAGIIGETKRLSGSIDAADLAAELRTLNDDDAVDGVLVQLPLPRPLPERDMLAEVSPEKDVDGFHRVNIGRLWSGEPGLTPATPTGVIELLHRNEIELEGRHAVIVGRSDIVGKPMAALLLRENATVTICHSRTRDLPAVCRQADLLVAAVGRPGMVGAAHVRPGAVVIDVGINRVRDPAPRQPLVEEERLAERHLRAGHRVRRGDERLGKARGELPVPREVVGRGAWGRAADRPVTAGGRQRCIEERPVAIAIGHRAASDRLLRHFRDRRVPAGRRGRASERSRSEREAQRARPDRHQRRAASREPCDHQPPTGPLPSPSAPAISSRVSSQSASAEASGESPFATAHERIAAARVAASSAPFWNSVM